MGLCSSNIKKIIIFSQKRKLLLYFWKWNPELFSPKLKKIKKSTLRKFLMLQETETLKNVLYFSQKKAALMFRETKTLKKLLIFQEVICKAWKSKGIYTFPYKEVKHSKLK